MAKTLKTSGDYTVKAGAGSAGSNTIRVDAALVRIPGDLAIDGTQTVINSTTLTVEDQFIEVNRNNSTAGTEDSGIFFNQGSSNNTVLYYDASETEFTLGSTTHNATVNEITNISLGNLRVADPAQDDHAATQGWVNTQIVAISGSSFSFVGDDSTGITLDSGETLKIAGGSNIASVVAEPDTITISLNRDLNGIDTISTDRSDQDLTLSANQAGSVVIDDVLTFSGTASDPSGTPTATKIYHKTVGGGDTGIYFKNPNDTVGELISKAKATALAIALG